MTTHPLSPLLALSPCPFCNAPAELKSQDGTFAVVCGSTSLDPCFCAVGERYDGDGMPDHVFLYLEDAINAWNRRPATELPDLPLPWAMYYGTHEDEHGKVTALVDVRGDAGALKKDLYTDDQMRAYATEAAAYWKEMHRSLLTSMPEWIDGCPPTWWPQEWFIAFLDNGDRVVLRPLPEEWTYDYTTADGTYFLKFRVRKWMQFPDTEFKTPAELRAANARGDGVARGSEALVSTCPLPKAETAIRTAIADYMWSEGCSCCQDVEAHDAHRDVLAKLLDVPPYEDGSGYDFSPFRTPTPGSEVQS